MPSNVIERSNDIVYLKMSWHAKVESWERIGHFQALKVILAR